MLEKIIHTVWAGKDEFRFSTIRHSWMEYNPDYSHMFWRNDENPRFWPEVNAILTSPKYTVTVKSDVLRLAVLLEYGGIYVDTDMVCLKSFDPLLKESFLIGYEEQSTNRIGLSLIGCNKNDGLMSQALKAILDNIRTCDIDKLNNDIFYHLKVCSVEGLQNIFSKSEKIYEQKYFYPVSYKDRESNTKLIDKDAYSLHLWLGTTETGWTKKAIFA